MSQVYITNASLNQISKSLRSKKSNRSRYEIMENISNDFTSNEIISNDILDELFNNSELKDIYFMKMILEDFSMLLEQIDGNKNIITESIARANKQYAYGTKAPSYHHDTQCQWMNKMFTNIEIPRECIEDIEMEKRAKEWLMEFRNLPFQELNEKFKIEFNCSVGLQQIERKNSGNVSFDNEEVQLNFNNEVKAKYQQLRFFLDDEFSEKLNKFKFAPSFKLKQILSNDNDTNSHQSILDFHSVKNSLKQIIYNFYKEKYNSELSFESTILDSIGFNKCRGCNK